MTNRYILQETQSQVVKRTVKEMKKNRNRSYIYLYGHLRKAPWSLKKSDIEKKKDDWFHEFMTEKRINRNIIRKLRKRVNKKLRKICRYKKRGPLYAKSRGKREVRPVIGIR
jgi:hypothetical protein